MGMEQAAQDIKYLSDRLSGLIELGKVIEQLGSLDQVVREKTNQIISLTHQVEEQADRLLDLNKSSKAAKDDAARIVQDAEKKAQDLLDDTDQEAVSRLVKANKTVDDLQAASDRAQLEAREQIAALKSDISDLRIERQLTQESLDALRKSITDLKSRF